MILDPPRSAFEPKGDLPEWRMLYDALLADADFETVITTEAFSEVLGRDFTKSRSPLYRAREHMGEMRHRWLEPLKGVGYRVIKANEHMAIAQQHKRRAKTQLKTMVKVAECTDLSVLLPDELARFDTQNKINGALYLIAVHHERRISRIENVLQKLDLL